MRPMQGNYGAAEKKHDVKTPGSRGSTCDAWSRPLFPPASQSGPPQSAVPEGTRHTYEQKGEMPRRFR